MNNSRPRPSRIRIRPEGPTPSVDGHPGWVTQSVKQYVILCGVTIGMHSFIAGASLVLLNARSAAWWITALGSLGGLLTWLPIYGIMKAEQAKTIDEAFKEAYGKIGAAIVMLLYTGVALFHSGIAIFIIGSFVRHFLIVGANGTVVAAAVLAVLSFSVCRYGMRGPSRLVWLLRVALVFAILLSCGMAVTYMHFENLFPLLGNDLQNTAFSLPISASCFVPVVSIGVLPSFTGSAKPVRFQTGLKAIAIGCVISTFLMLATNLSVPPQAVQSQIVWGFNLALSVEYMQTHVVRLFYFLALFTMLFLSGAHGIAVSVTFIRSSIFPKRSVGIHVILFLILFAFIFLLSNSRFAEGFMNLMVWRLPVAAIPAWITWGVLAIKKKRRAKG